ncbi:uncharacterized protein L3040_002479 [Drepanopeziza brunnea f. sp. 'multigermtubi']|uniref:uncharacterized protein n=1 Tax=Drepanopeziza brunnea f. sp. 'multigermtubi' TaxID=698441 RepID=UPI00238A7608|nr:hypothetical protein L3040_002479 [Drepanopeziza brunnea f. sp. 'multigermtubi']
MPTAGDELLPPDPRPQTPDPRPQNESPAPNSGAHCDLWRAHGTGAHDDEIPNYNHNTAQGHHGARDRLAASPTQVTLGFTWRLSPPATVLSWESLFPDSFVQGSELESGIRRMGIAS